MAKPFLFRCPTTGLNVQGMAERDLAAPDHYVAQTCIACGLVHLVNPGTGKLIAEEVERPEQQ